MGSKDTLQDAMRMIKSSLNSEMREFLKEVEAQDDRFRSGTKSAGAKARKASSEWGKRVTDRLKELREAKKLLAQYRKETISESKS